MEKIKLVTLVILSLSIIGFAAVGVFAQQEIILPIDSGVYQMITSPVLPEDPDPQVSLEDDLGPYDETEWRFFRYNPARGDYDELKSPDWNPIEDDFDFGRGYWIISSSTRTIDIQGAPTGATNQITLKWGGDGWNQIGNIYLQDFMIGMFPNCNLWVQPVNPGPLEIAYQLNDLNNPYTDLTLREYAGGSDYNHIGDELGEMLETGKGYWLKNTYLKDVILSFSLAGLNSVSTTSASNFPGEDFFARVAQQDDPPDPPPGISGSFSSGSGGGSVGCFIATAVYRDYDHPNVQLLRKFRDQYLLTNSFGRIFVDMYYRYSPTLAKFVEKRTRIRALVRFNLVPVMAISGILSKMNLYGFLIVLALPILMGFFLLIESGGWGGGRCRSKFSIKLEKRKGKT